MSKSDGCTIVPNGGFNHCCIEHDSYYEDGSVSRLDADNKLFKCIKKEGKDNIVNKGWHLLIASLYWLGVRIFGGNKYNG